MDNTKLNNIAVSFKILLEESGITVDNLAVFGSVMNGTDNMESDLDLIVVSDVFENKNIFQRAKMLFKPESEIIKKYNIPMDILSYTKAEYEESLMQNRLQSKLLF